MSRTQSPIGRKKITKSVDVNEQSPKIPRSNSLVKLFRKTSSADDSSPKMNRSKPATVAVPTVNFLFKRSSSGSLVSSAVDNVDKSSSSITPRSLQEVIKSPPCSSVFEANVVTNFPVLLVICQLIVDDTSMDDEEKLGLFVPLVEQLKMHDFLIKFVSFCANGEAKKCSDPNTLFRESSVLVMVFRALATSTAGVSYLKPLVSKISDIVDSAGPFNFEQDAPAPEMEKKVDLLSKTINWVFDCAAKSLNDCPPVLRIFFQTVFSIVNVRHPGYGFKSLANFYFLRFLLPAVTSSGVNGGFPLSSSQSKLAPQRDLKSYLAVSKVIQCIANNSLPDSTATIRHMSKYVESKSNFVETFFFNLITARSDDSVCELNSLEFNQQDFDALRGPLLGFLLDKLPAVRTRLGPSLQLHSWLASDDDVKVQMQELVVLGKNANGMLNPLTKEAWSAKK